MRIAILILYTESWQPLADVVFPIVNKYCDKHGYHFTTTLMHKYDGFYKLISIKNLITDYGTKYIYPMDAVWCIDLDTIITNGLIKIESFLDDTHDAYFTKDYNGLNCGSFIIKNSEWSHSFIDKVVGYRERPGMHCEQNGIERYMEVYSEDEKIKLLPHPSINSYKYELYPEIPLQTHEQGNWNPGDFILHLPGIGMDERLKILTEVKEQIIYE